MYNATENITQNTYQVTVTEQGSTYTVTVNEEVNTYAVSLNETVKNYGVTVVEDVTNYTIGVDRTIVLGTAIKDWWHYISKVFYTGNDTVLPDGEVLECLYESTTVYRYITNAEGANGYSLEDSFYASFDGATLSNLITTRG